jgi:hypothetical protein
MVGRIRRQNRTLGRWQNGHHLPPTEHRSTPIPPVGPALPRGVWPPNFFNFSWLAPPLTCRGVRSVLAQHRSPGFPSVQALRQWFDNIATFTCDLRRALTQQGAGPECFVIAVNDRPEGYAYSPDVRFEIAEQELFSYHLAADFLQSANVDVLCVQHEFGIYGGVAGRHLLALLRRLDLPIVTHLHTILEEPSLEQMDVMQELIRLSTRLIVMNKRGRRILKETYNTPSDRIDLIPHGIPEHGEDIKISGRRRRNQ